MAAGAALGGCGPGPARHHIRSFMADLRAALGHALEPAYRVEREVRPVGNCRMFVALEKSAGGGLLVKVLPGALSLAVDSTRFEQEIARLGRRLRHPSLVAPRNAGRVGSFVYHTRTFVEGTTLRAWLARHGGLPLGRGRGGRAAPPPPLGTTCSPSGCSCTRC